MANIYIDICELFFYATWKKICSFDSEKKRKKGKPYYGDVKFKDIFLPKVDTQKLTKTVMAPRHAHSNQNIRAYTHKLNHTLTPHVHWSPPQHTHLIRAAV